MYIARKSNLLLLLFVLLSSAISNAQSLKVTAPTHMSAGVNKGLVDSFVGDQFWDFYVTPGKFELTFAGGAPEEGFSVGGKPEVAIAFAPKTPGASFTQRTLADGRVVFSGSVKQRTRVAVGVGPVKSPLVRQTTAYTLVATGSVDFSGAPAAGSAPNVTGVYAAPGHGIAKFTADGNVVCTDGQSGHWELFDAESRTYVVTVAKDRWTLQFQPGRGFVDAQNGVLIMQMRH